MATTNVDLGRYQLGWHDTVDYAFEPKKGLSREVVEEISALKGEPEWMLRFRLRALEIFERKPMKPWFAENMPDIDFQDIYYYLKPEGEMVEDWEALPESVRETYEKLGIPEAERKYLSGVTAQYECLRGDSLVWTTAGMKPVKAIEPGDQVFSLDETTDEVVVADVVGAACSGEKEVFEIRARGRTLAASANHPFLVLRDERRPGRVRARYRRRWVPVEDLRPGDLVAIPTDLPEYGRPATLVPSTHRSGWVGPRSTNPDLVWWLGAYLGDGYVHHRGEYEAVEFAVDSSDETMVAELRRVALEQFALDFGLSADRQRLTARASGALAEWLELNGLGGTSHTKRVPDWVFGLPTAERLAFLAGYVDADGYVRAAESAKNVVLTSASSDLLEDMRQLALGCGIGAGRVRQFTSRHPHDPARRITAYRLHLSGRFQRLPCRSPRRSRRLGQRAYAHGYRSAKGTTFRAHTSDMFGFVRIESITPAGVEPVFDIEVAGHHNFVAEGFVVHNSEVVYHRNREDLEELGIFFSDMDTGLREHPEIVKEYLGTVIPPGDNKFAALNSAVWSGGSFIYVPPGVEVPMPLQAYFRINAENAGQFERTLIVVDEGASVHYVEGCSAPVYTTDSLHSAVVEIIARPGARVQYTTIQNWSPNVYNLVTKRARAEEDSTVVWIDGNLGSKLTMKYPSVYLVGPRAHGEVLSVAYAGEGQHQDAGAKMIHAAPDTSSIIESKSISKDGGTTTYRGLVRVEEGATNVRSNVRCDALILDEESVSNTYPYQEIAEQDVRIEHEATVSKVGEDKLFYLMSRGLSEVEAASLVVNGFIEPIVKTLPMEYAVELSRLIELEMEGAVG